MIVQIITPCQAHWSTRGGYAIPIRKSLNNVERQSIQLATYPRSSRSFNISSWHRNDDVFRDQTPRIALIVDNLIPINQGGRHGLETTFLGLLFHDKNLVVHLLVETRYFIILGHCPTIIYIKGNLESQSLITNEPRQPSREKGNWIKSFCRPFHDLVVA